MSLSKMRVVLFAALGMLMLGAFVSASAYATAGPFWHERTGGSGTGVKIEEKMPEQFQGEGGEQRFLTKIGASEIEFTAPSVQVKGVIYNNALQGQIKLELKYGTITVVKPKDPECVVTVGIGNTVKTIGHLAWKWNGQKKQLEEQPQSKQQKVELLFTPKEIAEGEKALPTGTFAEFTFKGGTTKCSPLVTPSKVEGSTVGFPTPTNLEEWSKTLAVRTPEGKEKQHFWNGSEFIGVETGLKFAGNEASLIGETKVNADLQEIAVFEK